MARIAQATGWPALGLVPYFADARLLPAEDALALEQRPRTKANGRVRIAVPILPHIANFDDLDPLVRSPTSSRPRASGHGAAGDADLVILPGSKATHRRYGGVARRRLGHRHRRASAARRHGARPVRRLSDAGRTIADPDGIEGPPAASGLGLLDVETMLAAISG